MISSSRPTEDVPEALRIERPGWTVVACHLSAETAAGNLQMSLTWSVPAARSRGRLGWTKVGCQDRNGVKTNG
jgi:hypothetical protein